MTIRKKGLIAYEKDSINNYIFPAGHFLTVGDCLARKYFSFKISK